MTFYQAEKTWASLRQSSLSGFRCRSPRAVCVCVTGDYFHLLMSVLLLFSCPPPSVMLFSDLFHTSLPADCTLWDAMLGCSTGLSRYAQASGGLNVPQHFWLGCCGTETGKKTWFFPFSFVGGGLQVKAVNCCSFLVREGTQEISYPLGHY